MSNRRALVVGLGIAGMATALSLQSAGWTPVIIERSAKRRTGGYFIGLFPEGQEAAKQLGVFEYIHTRNAHGRSWEHDNHGNHDQVPAFVDQPGSPKGVLRGDVEAGLWLGIEDKVEVRFSTVPVAITDKQDGVWVSLKNQVTGDTYSENFDLVIGADGLRSTVRSLVFGPHEDYLKSLNAIICAFEFTEQVPRYDMQDGITVCGSRRALWIFPFSDRSPTALFTYRTKNLSAQFKKPRLDVLKGRFDGLSGNGVVEHALGELARAEDSLFDSVYQVRMANWSKGKVVLVGDAAWCLTLYSGMGVTAGLKGGYELGRALQVASNDLSTALRLWESSMRPFVKKHQRLAYVKRELFVPSNRLTGFIRKAALLLMQRKASRATAGAESAGYLGKN